VVGDVKLDPIKRVVVRAGRKVDLSPREFSLLEFLMRNAGRNVSRSRIAEAVWSYQFDPETNVVDVYINYLRRKLTFRDSAPLIHTVRGVGYRMEAG
jgi:two-component system OmpR family response regulator